LITISTISPASIETLTLPILFHTLPDEAPPITAITARDHYRSIIASLTKLCVQPSLFETLVIRVTSKLELLSSPAASDGDVSMADEEELDTQRECTVAYAYALLHCLLSVIKDKLAAKHVDLPKYFDKVTPRLFSLAISALRNESGEKALFRDRRILEISAKIIEVLTWTINEEYAVVYATR
jgi:DNA repair/transcription protein MET18/MMS19